MSSTLSFQPGRRYSVDEYLNIDRASAFKIEYLDGEIRPLFSASLRHVLIATNIAGELGNRLKATNCQVYSSGLRIQANRTSAFHYPDVAVICGGPEYRDGNRDTVTNPVVIVEVLSSSTRSFDRGDKFASYRQLASLREYILIGQESCHVEHYVRKDGTTWEFTEISNCGGELVLPSLDIAVPLDEISAKLKFLEPEEDDLTARSPATDSHPF